MGLRGVRILAITGTLEDPAHVTEAKRYQVVGVGSDGRRASDDQGEDTRGRINETYVTRDE
eukprot:3554553-Pyramimonas_sp.AAC.1